MNMVRGLSIVVLVVSALGIAMSVPEAFLQSGSRAAAGNSLMMGSAVTLASALIALAISEKNRSN